MQSQFVDFLHQPFHHKVQKLQRLWRKFLCAVYYRHIFGSFGKGSVLYKPILLNNPSHIHIGNGVTIRQGARLEAVIIDPAQPPELRIGDNVNIEQDAHIVCVGRVVLHNGSGLAPRCTILCGTHPFFDVKDTTLIRHRNEGIGGVVEIGSGSILGTNSVIHMNVSIGRNSIVGANSVVRKSAPDFSIIDGSPASIVMRYDEEKERWLAIKK